MKRIITISREFGSGGRTIAKQVAENLGYAYYDKELIEEIAMETGFSKDYIEKRVDRERIFLVMPLLVDHPMGLRLKINCGLSNKKLFYI